MEGREGSSTTRAAARAFSLGLALALLALPARRALSAGAAPATACFAGACHADMAGSLPPPALRHDPLRRGTCESCHVPHDTPSPSLSLVQPVPGLCFSCHRDFEKRVGAAEHVHTPVKEGRCGDCHDPHGSNGKKLARRWWTPADAEWQVYGFSESIRRCAECHGRDLFREQETAAATAFRDGTRNLHAVHALGEKGRPCEVCHDPHAAGQPMQIRPDTPFGRGGWKLPISVTFSETGGQCVVGCHQERIYGRGRAGR